jgi:hypothetical protein
MPYPSISVSRYYGNQTGYTQSTLGKRDDEQKAKDAQKYLLVLADYRLLWEPMIDNIIAYVNHGRRFVQNWNQWPGQQTGQEVFDDSAMLARNKLRDGMVGYLCSRNQPWFALELPGKFNFPRSSALRSWSGRRVDEYPQVQRWLQDCQTVMYSAFNRSNFYDVVPEFISDGATCGTAHMLIEEDVAQAAVVFTVPHFRECFIAENQWGKVDTCYRVYKMTLRQLVDKFGLDKMKDVDPNFENEYKSNMYVEQEILHAVFPRADFEPGRVDARNKQWESLWVYCRGGKILDGKGGLAKPGAGEQGAATLAEGGYDSMPIISWRWRKNDDEVYGRGPAHDAFVSIAQANQMGRTNLITAHQAAEPPLVAYSDMRGAIQRGPAGITYMEANRGDIRARAPIPLHTGVQNLPFNVEYQDRVRQIINEHFHTDVFMMMSQLAASGKSERMVTEQISELQGEKAAILGTRVGNLQSEAFDPLIYRVYSIEAAAGRIPTPPDILLESVHGPMEVQYLGPLAQAQTRLTKVRAIQSWLGLVGQVAQFDPSVLHIVDSYQTVKELADAVSVPTGCVRDQKVYMGILQQLSKVAQQDRTATNLPKVARAAASLSKAPEAGSIVQQLMEGGGEAPAE